MKPAGSPRHKEPPRHVGLGRAHRQEGAQDEVGGEERGGIGLRGGLEQQGAVEGGQDRKKAFYKLTKERLPSDGFYHTNILTVLYLSYFYQ